MEAKTSKYFILTIQGTIHVVEAETFKKAIAMVEAKGFAFLRGHKVNY